MPQNIGQPHYTDITGATDGAETITLWEVDLSSEEGGIGIDDAVLIFEADVILKSASSLGASIYVRRTVRRFGGNLVALGSTLALGALSGDLGLATAAIVWDVTGDRVRLRVTGVLLQEITWTAYLGMWTSEFGA